MNSFKYINLLKDKLSHYFDIYEDYKIDNYTIPIVAKSVIRNERYAFSKKIVLDAYENYEYNFINYNEGKVTNNEIIDFFSLLSQNIKTIVQPNKEHMSSKINGIYITDTGFNQETIDEVEKFKLRKNFLFGLKGWCDIVFILVDLNKGKVYTSKQGKDLKSFYLSILED